MTSIVHLKAAFNSKTEGMVIGYMEVKVLFERYVKGRLTEKTRKKSSFNASKVNINAITSKISYRSKAENKNADILANFNNY